MKGARKIETNNKGVTQNEATLMVSEDDRLRSQYILQLILEKNSVLSGKNKLLIPHVLVQFWDSTTVPSDVSECMKSWKPLKDKGFDYILFDDEQAKWFILKNFNKRHLNAYNKCRHPAMRADYFRLCYLVNKGGFYVDADEVYKGDDLKEWFNDNKLKLHPLCYDSSTNSMVNEIDFMKTPCDSPNLTFYVNNNPIIAPPHHPVLNIALERSTQILLTQTKGVKQDVQSMTGPGNLTASLVYHSIETKSDTLAQEFAFLSNWNDFSKSQWPLEYRKDNRNWRLWNGSDEVNIEI